MKDDLSSSRTAAPPPRDTRAVMATLGQHAARVRYLWYTMVVGVFTLLFAVVTVRFTLGGVSFESFLLSALTFGLAFQTRRWYRRFRAVGRDELSSR